MNRLKQKDKALSYGILQPLMSWISGWSLPDVEENDSMSEQSWLSWPYTEDGHIPCCL